MCQTINVEGAPKIGGRLDQFSPRFLRQAVASHGRAVGGNGPLCDQVYVSGSQNVDPENMVVVVTTITCGAYDVCQSRLCYFKKP